MTKLLEQAVAKARALSEPDQDAIAQLVLAEIEADRQWEHRLAKPSDRLTKFADKAWSDHETGLSENLDPENL